MFDSNFISRTIKSILDSMTGTDATLGTKTDAKSTATDATAVTAMQVFKEMSYVLQTIEAYYSGAAVGNVPVEILTDGTKIGTDQTLSWLASALVNTVKKIDWTAPVSQNFRYALEVSNPSTVSDLICTLYNLETLWNGETRCVEIASTLVPMSTILLVENCEDAWADQTGGSCACDTDAVNYKVGSKSASFVTTSVGVNTLLATEEAIGAFNLSPYTHLRLWIKSTVGLSAGDLQILLDDTGLCASPLESINIPAVVANTWTLVYLPFIDRTLLTAIITIGLKQITDLADATILIDDVQAIKLNAKMIPLDYAFLGGMNMRQTLENATVLGANDAFSSISRLREI